MTSTPTLLFAIDNWCISAIDDYSLNLVDVWGMTHSCLNKAGKQVIYNHIYIYDYGLPVSQLHNFPSPITIPLTWLKMNDTTFQITGNSLVQQSYQATFVKW